jgi:hypothetical protein
MLESTILDKLVESIKLDNKYSEIPSVIDKEISAFIEEYRLVDTRKRGEFI